MESTYRKIKVYFKENHLTLNDKITECIIFNITSDIQIDLGTVSITPTDSVKFLGVHIDNKLSFKNEANHIVKNICRLFPSIYNIRDKITVEVKRTVLFSLINSILNYSSCFMNLANKSDIKKIKSNQKNNKMP